MNELQSALCFTTLCCKMTMHSSCILEKLDGKEKKVRDFRLKVSPSIHTHIHTAVL